MTEKWRVRSGGWTASPWGSPTGAIISRITGTLTVSVTGRSRPTVPSSERTGDGQMTVAGIPRPLFVRSFKGNYNNLRDTTWYFYGSSCDFYNLVLTSSKFPITQFSRHLKFSKEKNVNLR